MTESINLESWIKENLFDIVPMSIAVIDQSFNVVYANKAFESMFGAWENRKCFSVYKDRDSVCTDCKGAKAFKDGRSRINKEVGYDKYGQLTYYIKNTVPVVDKEGNIPFLLEMATDVTETEMIREEFKLLFDQVPCNILVIDRNFRIVRTNKRVRDLLGDITGQPCYEMLKWQDHRCDVCPAHQTFIDGQSHVGHQIWQSVDDKEIHSLVTTVPLGLDGERVDLVMEMAVDITQTLKLEDELKIAYGFMQALIATSMDGIIALDNTESITIFNRAARNIFNIPDNKRVVKKELVDMLPSGFIEQTSNQSDHLYMPEVEVKTIDGETVPVRLAGIRIGVEGRYMGMAISVQDLRNIKQLENEKLEAERLAAVGQTVAGLAHGIKNLITGLEGGMYMLNSGIKSSNIERIQKGLEMLNRNIERVSTFVREFLNFSKGREIKVALDDPGGIAEDVVELYAERSRELGIELTHEQPEHIVPAYLDSESMHECLTNLVANAIDACQMSEDDHPCHVRVRTFDKDGTIIYEVIDNGCGMDYEIKKKVFTNFFTTKGLGGTGIGLLMTKKIVQEHGGKIEMESEKGVGTTFRILLPRNRLPTKYIVEKDTS